MMKSFEQRKKEIRRRSEERIGKRRRRMKAVAGVAVCLLCVIGAGMLQLPENNENTMAMDSMSAYTDGGNDWERVNQEAAQETPEEGITDDLQVQFTSREAGEVVLRVTEVDTAADTLTMALTNCTNQQITYDAYVDIEYETENGWISCAETDQNREWALYILAPGDTVTETCRTDNFDLSEPGAYRLIKYCNLYVEQDSTPCRVVTEFIVEEAP